MSWMQGGGAPWDQDWTGGGEHMDEHKPKEFCKSLKPIKLSERYRALEPEEEEADQPTDNCTDGDGEDSEPGDFLRAPDPNCRADRVCPCGAIGTGTRTCATAGMEYIGQ